MFVNRSEKQLLCAPWLIAILIPLPAWAALWFLNHLQSDITWPIHAPVTFLLLILIYPVLEEIVFRGVVQGELMRKPIFKASYAGITYANILTSLLFAITHLYSHPFVMAMLVFLPSLIFGYFRDRFDGWLLPSMLLHIYYNLGYFLIFNPL